MKDAYYFSHDSNARNDHKMLQLRCELGWEGYGLFFALLEIMRDEKNYMFPSNAVATLTLCLSIDTALLDKFLNTCFSVGLLVDDGENISSQSFISRMEMMDSKRKKRVKAGRAGGNATAMLQQTSSNAVAKKGKEKKGKEKKETYSASAGFDIFWDLYPRKKDKGKSLIWWKKNVKNQIRHNDIINGLMKHLPEFKNKEQRFVPHPTTWLNGKRWEDEAEEISSGNSNFNSDGSSKQVAF
jgi:hypothetical protein